MACDYRLGKWVQNMDELIEKYQPKPLSMLLNLLSSNFQNHELHQKTFRGLPIIVPSQFSDEFLETQDHYEKLHE